MNSAGVFENSYIKCEHQPYKYGYLKGKQNFIKDLHLQLKLQIIENRKISVAFGIDKDFLEKNVKKNGSQKK